MSKVQLSIAIFGNTNNYPLLLAQGLMAQGHSVRLILNRKEILHRPEAKYPVWAGNYPNWIIDFSNVSDDDIAYGKPVVKKVLDCLNLNTDLVILNDTGLALASGLKSPHLALLTGSDLTYYANYDMLHMRGGEWDPRFKRSKEGRRDIRMYADFVTRQRDGILSAELVCYGQRGLVPKGDALLDTIGVDDSRRLMLYFSNINDLQPKKPAENACLTVLCGSRIVYRISEHPSLSEIDFKGTDVLIKGFARFLASGGNGLLKLPLKGQDVAAAVKLIEHLGIQRRVEWIPETPLAEFYEEMAAADLVCDQFGTSFPGMVTADAYALARPVMAYLRNEVFSQRFSEPLPGFDASTVDEVAAHLSAMASDRSHLSLLGGISRSYAEKYLSPQQMAAELVEKAYSVCSSLGKSGEPSRASGITKFLPWLSLKH